MTSLPNLASDAATAVVVAHSVAQAVSQETAQAPPPAPAAVLQGSAKRGGVVLALKRRWWALRLEAKIFALWFLGGFPLSVGNWLRARFLRYFFRSLGQHAVIKAGFKVARPEMITIGSHCNFARGVFITGGGGVTIGDWVGFGPDVKVWSVNHRFDDPDTPWQLQGWEEKPVHIEDDVWLGANVFVMPGVTIGKGAIVSAGAVVSKSIPAYALVAGNPARVVGWRKRPVEPQERPAEASERVVPGAVPQPTGTRAETEPG